MKTYVIDAAGLSLFVYECGDRGRPVLFWDGLGGSGLHANEIAAILVEEFGLRVIAPDAPGHGRSSTPALTSYLPSALATIAEDLLAALAVSRAAFVGFSWGAEVGCAFAARCPEQTIGLALIDGGYADYADRPGVGAGVGLEAHIVRARKMASDESYPSWEAYFQAEREALRRWTPALV
jgi:pimeloyl-ACP methyl ester carboxylesterase